MGYKVVHGNSLELLKRMPDNSIHAIVTDPPYGLSNTDSKHVVEAMTKWAAGERDFVPEIKGGGFMGKAWDSFVPPPSLWDECYRVLKPGGHLLCFAGTRTMDLMTLSIRLAGFDIRDSLAWLYGSGFPKGMNVGKAITATQTLGGSSRTHNRRAVTGDESRSESLGSGPQGSTTTATTKPPPLANLTPDAEPWEGWNTAIKPAFEPIIVARKALSEKTVAKNVLEHGTGAFNIEGCRIGSTKDVPASPRRAEQGPAYGDLSNDPDTVTGWDPNTGRYPANVILGHTEDCERVGTKTVKSGVAVNRNRSGEKPNEVYGTWAESHAEDATYGDENGNETVEAWKCAPGCQVAELDLQSGGASRFFYCAKAPKKERPVFYVEGEGVDTYGTRKRCTKCKKQEVNSRPSSMCQCDEPDFAPDPSQKGKLVHPTVKPLALMRWLVRLVTPPNGIVLDPFAGSGTTIEAAHLENFKAVGIEQDESYVRLCEVRMSKHIPESESREESA